MKVKKRHTLTQRVKVLEQMVGMMWSVIKQQGEKLKELNDENNKNLKD